MERERHGHADGMSHDGGCVWKKSLVIICNDRRNNFYTFEARGRRRRRRRRVSWGCSKVGLLKSRRWVEGWFVGWSIGGEEEEGIARQVEQPLRSAWSPVQTAGRRRRHVLLEVKRKNVNGPSVNVNCRGTASAPRRRNAGKNRFLPPLRYAKLSRQEAVDGPASTASGAAANVRTGADRRPPAGRGYTAKDRTHLSLHLLLGHSTHHSASCQR